MVTYTAANQWSGDFQADVTLTNTGAAALDGRQLRWAFPDGQKVGHMWIAAHRQTGAEVTAGNVSWNGTAAGASVSFGFTGEWSGENAGPGAFTLKGEAPAPSAEAGCGRRRGGFPAGAGSSALLWGECPL